MSWRGDPFFDECAASAKINESLRSHIKILQRRLSMVLVDSKNNLYLVPDDAAQLITEEVRVHLLAELQADQQLLNSGKFVPSNQNNVQEPIV